VNGKSIFRKYEFGGSKHALSYVKFFVKPGWGSAQRIFSIDMGSFPGMENAEFEAEGKKVNALIIPVKAFEDSHFTAGSFSD